MAFAPFSASRAYKYECNKKKRLRIIKLNPINTNPEMADEGNGTSVGE